MNKKIAQILVVLLILSTSFVFAEDATSSASVWEEDTSISVPMEDTSTSLPTAPIETTEIEPISGAATYTVATGDVMWKIAMDHGMTLTQLLALNPQVKDADMIEVGQVLNVKAGTAAPSASGKTKTVYTGLGHTTAFRNGPGSDSEGVPVYSFNVAMATATFDEEGRILNVFIDGYEVATPNYDGASMPHFSGWPNTEGYNVTDHNTELVSGISENTEESAAAEVNNWMTKRQRGDDYHMNETNEWYEQMNFYQSFFVGKTVAELEDWFAKHTTSAGRPIKLDTTNEDDKAKLDAFNIDEMSVHVDVLAGATMSIRDAHGDFLGAVANAYANRLPVEIPVE